MNKAVNKLKPSMGPSLGTDVDFSPMGVYKLCSDEIDMDHCRVIFCPLLWGRVQS